MSSAALPLPAEAAPKSKKKLLILIVAAVLLVGAAGGGAFWFMHQKAAAAADEHADEDQPKAKKKRKDTKPPVFTTLENFTVNLAGGDHFLQLGIVLQLKDEETAEKVKTFLPQIRNRILLLLSSKTVEELETPKGKQALVEEILADTREPIKEDGEDVQAILLGSMLIQ